MPNIYTYVDNTGHLAEVFESDLNFSGEWSPDENYYRFDVVTYESARYVCTSAVSVEAPPSNLQFSSYWSIIAFTSTGTASSGTISGDYASLTMAQDVYSLAYRAYSIALTGTDLPTPGAVAPWVLAWIGHTYNIATAGTNAANSAWSYAGQAYNIAVAGTNAANQANAYAGQAYNIAVAGTNAANQTDITARIAWSLSNVGTNAVNQTDTTARIAWSLANDGTTAAASADMWGRTAYHLGVSGTNAANQVNTVAFQAYDVAVAGTNAANQVNTVAFQAYDIAVAGTNAANAAWNYAGQAYNIAVAGTNAASVAQSSADAAYSLALNALYTAWTGTDLPASGGGSGTVPGWVMDWLGHTYSIATAGTNAANQVNTVAFQAYDIAVAGTTAANSADMWGRTAYHLGVTGTNAADQAYSLALNALYMAWVGTDTPVGGGGSGSFPPWVMEWIGHTYNIAVAGTNAANQVNTVAFQAYNIAVAGTNAANLAYSLATTALQTAWVGTTTPSAGTLYVLKTGDTMTGTLSLAGNPTYGTHAATKDYVDSVMSRYNYLYVDASYMVARATNGPSYGTNESTTNKIMTNYWSFDGTSTEYVQFKLVKPDDWNLDPIKAKFYWGPDTGGSGTAQWGIKVMGLSDLDTIDTSIGSTYAVSDTVSAVGKLHISQPTASVTVANSPAMSDMLFFEINRDPSSDTMTQDARLYGVHLQYKQANSLSAQWVAQTVTLTPPTTNLRAWWKADAIIGLSDQDALTTWEDSHTNNIDLTQATTTAKPKYRTNVVNGKPAVVFDPTVTGRFLAPTTACVGAFTEGEIFAIVKITTEPPASATWTGLWQWGGTGERMHFPWNGDSVIYDNFGSTFRKTVGNPTPALTSWRLYNTSSKTSEWIARIDGTSIFSTASNATAWSGNEFLGKSLQASATDYWFNGTIAEVLIYSAVLSSTLRDEVEAYLADKYALTIA